MADREAGRTGWSLLLFVSCGITIVMASMVRQSRTHPKGVSCLSPSNRLAERKEATSGLFSHPPLETFNCLVCVLTLAWALGGVEVAAGKA